MVKKFVLIPVILKGYKAMIKITKGLDLPLAGVPKNSIEDGRKVKHVAVVGPDYIGMRPTMLVKVGEQVKTGQKLFIDKKIPGVFFTAPAAGEVVAIHRGERRAFQSLMIRVSSEEDHVDFEKIYTGDLENAERGDVEKLLIESGLWTSLRTRPFSKTPEPGTTPKSIFVTAMDTNPLAMDPAIIIEQHRDDFNLGLKFISKLTDGVVYLCVKKDTDFSSPHPKILIKKFAGPHPAGNVGVHIHHLDPVGEHQSVWHIGYQDVIAAGKLFKSKKLWTERYVALTGPAAKNPRIIKTRIGACLDELVYDHEIKEHDGDVRIISGSVLNGTHAIGDLNYLGRFHNQITFLKEGNQRELFGWAMPGFNKFSVINAFVSRLFPWKKLDLTTNRNGGKRAIVPIGMYEKVMPGDFLATTLLKAIVSCDIEDVIQLGILELDEEDLALATFVCPGKTDFGKFLRRNLDIIEKEG